MPRAMDHPLYVYTPRSPEVKRRLSMAHRRRLGIPDGHRQVCGVHVPDDKVEPLGRYARWVAAHHGFDEARKFLEIARDNGWLAENPNPVQRADWALGLELLEECTTPEEIAEFFGVKVQTAYNALREKRRQKILCGRHERRKAGK